MVPHDDPAGRRTRPPVVVVAEVLAPSKGPTRLRCTVRRLGFADPAADQMLGERAGRGGADPQVVVADQAFHRVDVGGSDGNGESEQVAGVCDAGAPTGPTGNRRSSTSDLGIARSGVTLETGSTAPEQPRTRADGQNRTTPAEPS